MFSPSKNSCCVLLKGTGVLVVCCMGLAPLWFGVLVCWWCVPEVPPLCGLVVFVIWRVGVDVCVFLLGDVAPCGLVVLVGWWCVGGVLPGGALPHCGLVVGVLVWWCPCMCVLPGG